jgi:hypothetical protein
MMLKSRNPNFARTFATGLIAAALAAPLAASAATGANTAAVVNTLHPIVLTPEQIIQNKAAALGAAFTGNAVSSLECVTGGYRIRYENCDVYYSPSTGGVCETHGGIQAKYNYLGGPNSGLGLPQCDESGLSDGKGRYNVFSNNNSAIVWHPTTGPMEIQGAIHREWINEGSDTGPLGYPTSDEIALEGGAAYSDFQNGLLYWDGSKLSEPLTAGLTGAQMQKVMRNLVVDQNNIFGGESVADIMGLDSFSFLGASNTGYDFQRTGNRRVTFRLEGDYAGGITTIITSHYVLDLTFLFFSQKEADGSTSLRVQLVDQSGYVTGMSDRSNRVTSGYLDTVFIQPFKSPRKLIGVTIPAIVKVLSFKVLPDGGLQLYLQPDGPNGGAALVQLAVQLALNRLAQ